MAKVMFGGLQGSHRVMVVDGVTMHIPEVQVQSFLSGEPGSPNDPLSKMPDGKLCGTLVPEGSVKFTLTDEELSAAREDYNRRNQQ